MNDKKDFSDIFDDNFEVTYEDDFAAADADYYANDEYDKYDDEYEDEYDRRTGRKKRSADREQEPGERKSSRRKKSRGVPLAAPIRKGGRTLSICHLYFLARKYPLWRYYGNDPHTAAVNCTAVLSVRGSTLSSV